MSADAVLPSKKRGAYGYGYYLRSGVRVPQLGMMNFVWVLGALLLANAYMMISLFRFYQNMADYSHGLLVPVIAAAAAWRIYRDAEDKPTVSADPRGLLLLFLGLFIQFCAMWYEIGLVAGGIVSEYFTSVGLVLSLWGLFICFFGLRALRLFWFPLLYLCFLIPGLPGPPEVWLKNALRGSVTQGSATILGWFGYSVLVEKNVLEIPGVVLGVADACSGIRSLWAMLAVAPAIAWFLRLRPFLIALFIPLGVFLAMFQNVIRVVATAVLCDFFDMSWAEGTKHDTVGGISFFLSSLIMVFAARLLAPPAQAKKDTYGAYGTYGVYGTYGMAGGYGGAYTAENAPEEKDGPDAGQQRDEFFRRTATVRAAVFLLLGLMGVGQLMIFQRYAVRNRIQYGITQNRLSLDSFPGTVGPYKRIYWGELPDAALRILKPSESYVAWYSSPDNRLVSVIINFWEPVIGFNGNSWAFPHSPDVCFREAGWQIEKKIEPLPELTDPDEILYSRLYKNDRQRQMVLYWYNRDFITQMMNEFIDIDVDESKRGGRAHSRAYLNRLDHVVNSWKSPRDYSRFQYSIGIYVQEQGGLDETVELAQDFARHLRKEVVAFGLRPLQKSDIESLAMRGTATSDS